jgi:hypothetical protein
MHKARNLGATRTLRVARNSDEFMAIQREGVHSNGMIIRNYF